MSAPAADLTGWTAAPFTGGGFTHDVYRKGEGPGVLLIPEIPGIHPGVLALGDHLVDNGFTTRTALAGWRTRCSPRRSVRSTDTRPTRHGSGWSSSSLSG